MTTTAQDGGAGNGIGAAAETSGLDSGNYEVIRARMIELGRDLARRAETLNTERKEKFGGQELDAIGTQVVRTENNCQARDVIAVNGFQVFGYNVFIGLKRETALTDVLSLHKFETAENGTYSFNEVPASAIPGFLDAPEFVREFAELYQYYKNAKLLQLRRLDHKLLAVFQVGETVDEVRVFRWEVRAGGVVKYLDNRGEADHVFPGAYDFEWDVVTREMQVQGKHPHVNIEDIVFVETVGGDLTIKVEDNTEDGLGVYRENVEDKNQSLGDAKIYYKVLGALVLLKILPYREKTWRYLVYNTRAQTAVRIDALGFGCHALPEDHGIVFPGGYYLQTGDHKVFDADVTDIEFVAAVRSPNGEDVLYVFHHRDDGRYLLLPYNMIRKEISNFIDCHGYSLFEDGTMVVFRTKSPEPSRAHEMQIWQTPFMTLLHAAQAPTDGSYLANIGNADLVRGISECLTIRHRIEHQEPTRQRFEDLARAVTRTIDAFHWLNRDEVGDLRKPLDGIRQNVDLIIDEFDKVVALKKTAVAELEATSAKQRELIRTLRPASWKQIDQYMGALAALRTQRGHIITLRDVRYIDLESLAKLEKEAVEQFDTISHSAVEFLLDAEALAPLLSQLTVIDEQIEPLTKASDGTPLAEELARINEGLDVISEVVSGLEVDDPTKRTTILEGISEVFSTLNRVRATLVAKRKELMTSEGKAEFVAQFKLLGQSVSSALALADTPDKCDDQLSRMMVQLEDLEGKFSEFDDFLGDLASKREEIYEAFTAKRQTLLDARQRRAGNLVTAAERIIQGVQRRAKAFKGADELNAYFASDPMVHKLTSLSEQLLSLGDSVKGDEVASKLKSARQEALRGLRDRLELYDDSGDTGGPVIKMGTHRFNVNTQALELTMVPRGGVMMAHLTGTDFHEPITDARFLATKEYWDQNLVSENRRVYRGEYLAASVLFAAQERRDGLSLEVLHEAEREQADELLQIVRRVAGERYDEGYERGLHDADATAILRGLLSLTATAEKLKFPPRVRAVAALFWASLEDDDARDDWALRARSMGRLLAAFEHSPAADAFAVELAEAITQTTAYLPLATSPAEFSMAGKYLAEELRAQDPSFTATAEAMKLRDGLLGYLDKRGQRDDFDADMRALTGSTARLYTLCHAWVAAFSQTQGSVAGDGTAPNAEADSDNRSETKAAETAAAATLVEAAALLVTSKALHWNQSSARTTVIIEGVLGQHPNIHERKMTLRLDEFLTRLRGFVDATVPGYRNYRKVLQAVLDDTRSRLRIDEFMPRVLSSFVRNRLINEVYLPEFGKNMAKQLGAAGAKKRTDLMGLLLLISPPGYGKTTLMEYIASRLGLVFMKINGPALGHEVHSLDPADAPNATARQEVEKINLALEMGNNVMLYLDDIQHTHPELLQKFISLCDAQRRIEGVWNGKTKTYDLRGKKFCVVMAGNPYTESGEKFQIPDMLSNRADAHNLGDMLDGYGEVFALSYVENSLTSNEVLAPLTGREQSDVYKIVRIAQGEQMASTELSHPYSAVELSEIVNIFKKMFRVQEVLLAVNQEYIRSASMDDAYRTEPPFKLQGSYRNMNKMAEKLVSAMNEEELEALIRDHFKAEAQTLTSGAEQNLLKLGELTGSLSEEEAARWENIKTGYVRTIRMGGKESDPVTRVTGSLSILGDQLGGIRTSLMEAAALAKASVTASDNGDAAEAAQGAANQTAAIENLAAQLQRSLKTLSRPQLEVNVSSPTPEVVTDMIARQLELLNQTILPLARAAAHNLQEGRELHQVLIQLASKKKRSAPAPAAAAPPARQSKQPPAQPQPPGQQQQRQVRSTSAASPAAQPQVARPQRKTERTVGRPQRDTPYMNRDSKTPPGTEGDES